MIAVVPKDLHPFDYTLLSVYSQNGNRFDVD